MTNKNKMSEKELNSRRLGALAGINPYSDVFKEAPQNQTSPQGVHQGVTILDAKVVGLCSKHRKEGDEIPRYKNGTIIEDEFISCLADAFPELNKEQNENQIVNIFNNYLEELKEGVK